jgi:hypothetical protein
MSPPLQSITEELLIQAIGRAASRIVLVAPAVWPPIADALAASWHRLGGENVSVILDVDAEVCRLGYGSIDGLNILQEAASTLGQAIGHEPGVRICVLIADAQTFVFSPTPRLIESPPGASDTKAESTTPRTNGIILQSTPPDLKDQLGVGPAGAATLNVGLEPVQPGKVESVSKDLHANPPKPFDLTRAVNVYNAKIRFVEFRVTGYRVSEHTVSLPKHLVSIVRKNKALDRKISSALKLLDSGDPLVGGDLDAQSSDDTLDEGDLLPQSSGSTSGGDDMVSQSTVEGAKKKIEAKFLKLVPKIGRIIRRSDIPQFEEAVTGLDTTLKEFSDSLQSALAENYRKTAEELAEAILPEVLQQLPDHWKKLLGPNPDRERVRYRIMDDLQRAFGDPDKKARRIKSSVVFKDVTYEMLKDPDFIEVVMEHFRDLPILTEYVAAKERPSTQEPSLLD